MIRFGRVLLIVAVVGIVGLSSQVSTPVIADEDVQPIHLAPKVCNERIGDPFVCSQTCPGFSGCGLTACTQNCTGTVTTCYYVCRF